jgi:hypothetical protein
VFGNATDYDIIAAHDPNYEGPETPYNLRARLGEPQPVWRQPLPEPPETVDIGSMPSRDQEFTGVWEIVSRNTDEVVSIMSGLGNAVADAERHAANWVRDTGFDDPIYVRPRMQARQQAQGTESLPPGNTRWRVLDSNDREVYSFIGRSNQSEANATAANWLRGNNMAGQGEFTVVPAR